MHPTSPRRLLAVTAAATSILLVSACAQTTTSPTTAGGSGAAGSGGATLTIGTTDKVTALDPAGSYDNGSLFVMTQVYPWLLSTAPGSTDTTPKPDIAESASFTSPTEYTVKLKSGLKFANGHDLAASDVKFSFDRMLKINDPNGPASLLGNLDSTTAKDATTVVFKLKAGNDQTFPGVLTTIAAPIVDEEVFPADKLLGDDDIVKAHPFAGQYDVASYKLNELVSLKKNDGYKGALGAAKNAQVNIKYFGDATNMKLDVTQGTIDVAHRSLSATDIEALKKDDKLQVTEGPGGEIRYMVFNFDTMPFGTKTPEADAKKSLAVRQAMANLIDRQAIATQVFKDTYSPLYSFVPNGLTGADTPLKSMYGDGNGKPSADKAKKALADAGITTPIKLTIQYSPNHYGPSSGDEYAMIKSQLEAGGLFQVTPASTEWVQYSKDRTKDVYPIYQLGWFPDFSDADNYLTPFFTKANFLVNHYDSKTVQDLIAKEATETDPAKRTETIKQIQAEVAKDLSTLPMLQGKQVVVSGKAVKGVTLDGSFLFRVGQLSK